MSFSAKVTKFKRQKDVVELTAGRYKATVAPFLGSNVIHFTDEENRIDFFRNDDSRSLKEIMREPVIYGFPTLYLPNRLHNGILKASDHTYEFPVNETALGNFLHGFLHKREHEIVATEVTEDSAIAKTSYTYNEADPMYKYFPVKFRADYTFTLKEDGLHYEFTMTNLSRTRQLPFGMCNHTAFNGPFVEGAEGKDTRLYVPVADRWVLDENCIPTLEIRQLSNHDRQYLTGSQVPVLQDIDNDVYNIAMGEDGGEPFYGSIMTDEASGKQIVYEVSKDFKFWIIWNHKGDKEYFCVEPMTWMIDAPNLGIAPSESGYLELAPGESKTVSEHIYSR